MDVSKSAQIPRLNAFFCKNNRVKYFLDLYDFFYRREREGGNAREEICLKEEEDSGQMKGSKAVPVRLVLSASSSLLSFFPSLTTLPTVTQESLGTKHTPSVCCWF
jgi:hypothetical protein